MKQPNIYILISLSAVLFSTAFIFPTYFSWLVFIFLIPLFYVTLKENLSFKHGFFWGTLFFSIHGYGFLRVIIDQGQGSMRFLAVPLLVFYCAMWSGLWFLLANFRPFKFASLPSGRTERKSTPDVPEGSEAKPNELEGCRGTVWILTTYTYFLFSYYALFFIFGQEQGYSFGLPLLPLAAQPQWLHWLPALKHQGLLLLLIFFQMLVVVGFLKDRRYWVAAVICFLPFAHGWFVSKPGKPKPDFLKNIAFVPTPEKNMNHQLDAAQEITYALQEAAGERSDANLFIMSENSYPFILDKDIEQMWKDVLPEGTSLLIGAHRKRDSKLFNSLFLLGERPIIKCYDKSSCFFITERPCWAFNTLFLKNKKGFSSNTNKRKPLGIPNVCSFSPYICSDLFFATEAHCPDQTDTPLLVAVNDRVLSATSYLQYLALLFAVFKSIEWQRDTLYVGYSGAAWITQCESPFDLI